MLKSQSLNWLAAFKCVIQSHYTQQLERCHRSAIFQFQNCHHTKNLTLECKTVSYWLKFQQTKSSANGRQFYILIKCRSSMLCSLAKRWQLLRSCDSCRNQERSCKPSWDSSTKGIYMDYAGPFRPCKSYRVGWVVVCGGGWGP